MRNKSRSNSTKELVSPSNHEQIVSKRTVPKSLPPMLSSDLHYSAYLRYQSLNTNTDNTKSDREDKRRAKRSKSLQSRSKSRGSERCREDNVVVIQDSLVKQNDLDPKKAAINHNPFHTDFNKIIENPFLKIQEQSMTTEITDVITDDDSQLESVVEVKPREVVNTAIVDIYDADESCDPFLKMRVSC